ncbi:MAG: phospholipase D-like domain-containing protein [Armatimonadota bacterium]
MISIINQPIHNIFMERVNNSERSIKLCSPYVKSDIIDEIYQQKNPNVGLSLITNVNLRNYYKKSSDIDAISSILSNNDVVINFQNLHAKFYIFDDCHVIITSANLTISGFRKNYEYGVESNNEDLVTQAVDDYTGLYSNDLSGKITKSHTAKIIDILSSIPVVKEPGLPAFKIEYDENETFTDNSSIIINNLTGWKRTFFEALQQIPKIYFPLQEVYSLETHLMRLHPDNKHIRAKIRQQLQFLRDIGLIKFMGSGQYRKLWN